MRKHFGMKGYLWARTLYLLFAVALVWVSCIHWNAFLYGSVLVLAPWTVALVACGIAFGQVRWNKYHVLLFAAAAFYVLAALRNGNLSPRGLLVVALGFGTALLAGRMIARPIDAPTKRRLRALGLLVAMAALAVLLLTVICEFFHCGDWLPWVAKRAGAHTAKGEMLRLTSQRRTLKGLAVLTSACGALLVAGIVPRDADAAYLRREGQALCLFIAVLALMYLAPAVATVFTGEPIVVRSIPTVVGIQSVDLYTDRIWAFQHPNKVAMYAVASMLCAAYCMVGTPRRWLRGLLALFMLVFLMALAHSQSRTSDLALGVGVGALAFRQVWLHMAHGRWRVPVGLAAWALSVALVIVLVSGVFTADVFIATRLGASAETNLLESLRESAAEKSERDLIDTIPSDNAVEVADGVMVSRTMSAGFLDVFSNGRDTIWKEGMDYLINHPGDMLLGMGSDDIIERMKEYNPNRRYANHMHNSFLEALARGGLFMLLSLLGALSLLIKPTARLLVATDGDDPGAHILAVIIGVLLTISLVEVLLFTEATVYNILFFYAAGRVMSGCARDMQNVT